MPRQIRDPSAVSILGAPWRAASICAAETEASCLSLTVADVARGCRINSSLLHMRDVTESCASSWGLCIILYNLITCRALGAYRSFGASSICAAGLETLMPIADLARGCRINSALLHMRDVTDFYTVVDTASQDDTIQTVREMLGGVPGQTIQHGPLQSFADARNHALKVRPPRAVQR